MNDNRRHSKFFKRIFFGGSFTLSKKKKTRPYRNFQNSKPKQIKKRQPTSPFHSALLAVATRDIHVKNASSLIVRTASDLLLLLHAMKWWLAGVRAATLSFWGSSALAAADVVARFVCFKALLKAYKHFTRLGALRPQKIEKK